MQLFSWYARISIIGVGCPGHSKNGILMAASNLPTFKEYPMTKVLSNAFKGIPCVLLNDANAAIAAEVWGIESKHLYKSYSNIAMITLGTGIGLGLILNGQLYQGSNGLIEGGHMILATESQGGRKCGCGQTGCAEITASARMTAKRYLEKSNTEPSASFGAKDVFELAKNGDETACTVLEEVSYCYC